MDLIKFIEDPGRHQRLAEEVGTTKAWLWQIATGWRGKRASTDLAMKIESASRGIGPEAVSRSVLRPDIWPAGDMQAANDPEGPSADAAEEG
ncbi:hypothetical protein [Luteimonas notoginsengisoli]|uniref:Helix-turn-helix domain-containing protein n=1 Tax=Luteimonas notoginsengisoli TaxID=1578200 RepID=A0ABV7UR62_9GAMM